MEVEAERSRKKLCHLKFDYLIYASLRSDVRAGDLPISSNTKIKRKATKKLFSRLFKFNLKLNFRMKAGKSGEHLKMLRPG